MIKLTWDLKTEYTHQDENNSKKCFDWKHTCKNVTAVRAHFRARNIYIAAKVHPQYWQYCCQLEKQNMYAIIKFGKIFVFTDQNWKELADIRYSNLWDGFLLVPRCSSSRDSLRGMMRPVPSMTQNLSVNHVNSANHMSSENYVNSVNHVYSVNHVNSV